MWLLVGCSISALTIHNQIERFTMQPTLNSLTGPIALVRQRNVCKNDFQLFCAVKEVKKYKSNKRVNSEVHLGL